MEQLRRTVATAAAYDLECELLTPEQAGERYPLLETSDLLGGIWLPGDGTANPTDLTQALAQGSPAARRDGRRARPGHRGARRRRGGHRRAYGPGRHRGRDRGQLRRPVGAPPRRADRRRGAAALRRALLRRDGPDRGRTPRPADPARPRRLHVLQGGGRRARRRRLRARGQAVGRARRDPVSVRVPAARRGLGPLPDPDGQRARAHTGAARRRHPQVLQRARELHARQPVHPRRGAVGPRASSSAPASTRSASRRRAARVARWPNGSSRASRRSTCWPSTSAGSRRSRTTRHTCGRASPRCSACTTPCRGPIASTTPRGRCGPLRSTSASPRPTPASAARWAGSAPTSSRRLAVDPAIRVRLGQAELAAVVRGRAAGVP